MGFKLLLRYYYEYLRDSPINTDILHSWSTASPLPHETFHHLICVILRGGFLGKVKDGYFFWFLPIKLYREIIRANGLITCMGPQSKISDEVSNIELLEDASFS
jgi:hypothetical protein